MSSPANRPWNSTADAPQADLWDEEVVDDTGEGAATSEAPDATESQPQAAALPEAEPEAEPEPEALDWHSRTLLGQLYHAVVSHLEIAQQEPSDELHRVLEQVRAELFG